MLRLLPTLLLPSLLLAQEPKKDDLKPIPLVDLKRTDPVSFEKEIMPIFVAKCQVCHSGNLTEGKFDLSTYASMMKGGKRGAAIVAGKADESFLFKSSAHLVKPIMPPKSEDNPLTSKEASLLKLWIDQGAKPPAVDVKAKRTVVLSLPPALVKPVRAVAISPDRSMVAAGRSNQIHLFDAKTGEFKTTLVDPDLKTADGKPAKSAHISLVEAMAYSPDGKTLATGSFQELTLWDVEKGTPKQRITGFADRVVAIAYSNDGKFIATGGGAPTEDGEIRIYDAAGKLVQEIKNGHSDTVFGVAFSPDGKLLATSGADKFVKVFEVPSGKLAKTFEGHTHHVMDVGWTNDGKKLASAGADNIVKVWDFEKGEKLRDIAAAQKQVTRLVFVPKTANFITAAGDAGAKLWSAESGQSAKSYAGSSDFLYAVAVSDDGKIVATGGEDGIVRLYDEKGAMKPLLPPGAELPKEAPKKK
jgi:WD40 repeat protein